MCAIMFFFIIIKKKKQKTVILLNRSLNFYVVLNESLNFKKCLIDIQTFNSMSNIDIYETFLVTYFSKFRDLLDT